MSILGIGGSELVLIGLLILLILGPDRAPQAARAVGRQWRRMITSEWWAGMSQFAYSVRNLPATLTKLAEIEDIQAQLAEDMKTVQQVQQEIQEVAKPAQEALSGKPIQQAAQGIEAELKKSLAAAQAPGGATAAGETKTAAAESGTVAATAEGVAAAGTEAPEPAAPELSIKVDEETLRLGQEIAGYVERLPGLFERLEQVEKRQAQLLEQMEAMQRSTDLARLEAVDPGGDPGSG